MSPTRPFHFLTAALAATSLSACSGTASFAPAGSAVSSDSVARQSIVDNGVVDATAVTVFVSDEANNAIDVYNAKGKLLYNLSGFSEPQGLAADAAGSLYVADTSNSRIVVFAKPHGGAPVDLNDAGEYPAGVAVAPGTGLVAVTNIISTSGGSGDVAFYKKAAVSPCATVANAAHFSETYYGAFDAEGDLFIDGFDASGHVVVGEIRGGCSATTIQPLTFEGAPLGFPGGVAVNVKDQIVIGGTSALYTFAKPVHGSFGNPLHVTTLSGAGPGAFVFTKSGQDLWAIAGAASGSAAEYAYPKGGLPLKTFALQGAPIGIAITPAATP